MDKETIQRARQANLAEYLLSVGVPLAKNGNRYRHKDHDSLTFTKNAYCWNSRQEHGNAIDYLYKHMNMSFVDAVAALANVPEAVREQKAINMFELDNETLCYDSDKVKKYLNKNRLISHSVINYLIGNRLLFQEKRTNNAFFPIYDECNNCVGAELHGILKKRFVGAKAGNKYGYGYNIKQADDGTYDYILFFESAIDLISFIDYKLNHEQKTLKRCAFVSMGGLKINIVKHMTKVFGNSSKIVMCVDNDEAGQGFKREIENAKITYIDSSPSEEYKDWNEQLIDMKKNNKPISRLFKQYSLTDKPNLTKENTQYKEMLK